MNFELFTRLPSTLSLSLPHGVCTPANVGNGAVSGRQPRASRPDQNCLRALVLLLPPLPGTSCRRHAPPVPLRAPRRRTPSPCPAVTPLLSRRSSHLTKRTPISPQPPPRARAKTQSRAPLLPVAQQRSRPPLLAVEPPPRGAPSSARPRPQPNP